MGSVVGGVALLLVAIFMLVGFFRSDVDASAPATLVAVLIAIALPAGGGVALLARHFGVGRGIERRRDELRRRTLEAEVLGLATRHGGRLTVVEVVTGLAVGPDEAKHALDTLMARDLAEIEVTESGLLVYVFHDAGRLEEKTRSRGILDA